MSSTSHTPCHVIPRAAHGSMRYASELFVGVVIVCIALHTFFLAGLIVPVAVSGGSMAETILGPRREVICPHCGITFSSGHERLPANGRAVCLNCGARNIDLNAGWDWPGEHAVIDRASLDFRAPRRWEVLVFRCPEQADTYCIKRVVGLPGESIQIRNGDVYVNGIIARKNLSECRAVAQLMHDASFAPSVADGADTAPGWRAAEGEQGWSTPSAGSFTYAQERALQGDDLLTGAEPAWIEFRATHDRPVTDDDAYNQSESRRLNTATDLMLRCEVKLVGDGKLTIRSEVEHDRFEVHLQPANQTCSLVRNGQSLKTVSISADTLARSASLEMIRFDQQILLTIGGELLLQQEFTPLPTSAPKMGQTSEPASPAWAIGAISADLEVRHLQVLRDIYYTVPRPGHNAWGVRKPVSLPEDAYFVLGDNSPISADSRTLEQPCIERKLLVGRLLATW